MRQGSRIISIDCAKKATETKAALKYIFVHSANAVNGWKIFTNPDSTPYTLIDYKRYLRDAMATSTQVLPNHQ